MNNDLNLKVLESYVEIDKIHDAINNKLFNFITKATELVELSDDDYQIERTLKLNKISLKGFILDSSCCLNLSINNIVNYSLQELKNYFIQYQNSFNEDCSKYYLAISLYELIEEIESLVDSKINLEIESLSKITPDITLIKDIDKDKYEETYLNLKEQLNEYFKNDKLEEKTYNICIETINSIFNFYISGYPNIPNEYLYKNDGS